MPPFEVDGGRPDRKHATADRDDWGMDQEMRATRSIAAAMTLLGAIVATAGAETAPLRGDPQAGERLALRVCDACHVVAAHQELAPLVAHYAPSFFAIARRPGTSAPSLAAFLAHPHPLGQMPYPGLTADQIANVSAYILSLRARH